jgi:5-methyltetrahydrofolate--homocysteine methyltransferase
VYSYKKLTKGGLKMEKDILLKIKEAVYNGEEEDVKEYVEQALEQGVEPQAIIQDAGVPALNKLGEDFNNMVVFLPELMIAGDCMKMLISMVNPYVESGAGIYKGKIILGCAKGDLHDIGKSLVATQLSINGYEVIDLGTDVSNNAFVDAAEAANADVIALSSLLTTSQYYMEDLIKHLEKEGKRDKYRIVVGGGPINAEYAKMIGADGYARTADLAVKMLDRLIKLAPGSELVVEV